MNQQEKIYAIKEKINKYSQKSLEQEIRREQDLLAQSNANVITLTILITALLTIIFKLLEILKTVEILIVVFGIILVSLLFLSLLFSILAQWVFKRYYRVTPEQFHEHVNRNINDYQDMEAYLDQEFYDINSIQNRLMFINKKRSNFIKVSLLIMYLFIALIFIFSIVILIVV